MRRVTPLLVVAVLAAACADSPTAPGEELAPFHPALGANVVYGSYIVVLKDGANPRSVAAIAGVRPADGLWLAAAHDAAELAIANRHGADGVFLSPVFPTRSHPGAPTLGKAAFLGLAASSDAPVIALGGMDAEKAAELGWRRWGAIDGLS